MSLKRGSRIGESQVIQRISNLNSLKILQQQTPAAPCGQSVEILPIDRPAAPRFRYEYFLPALFPDQHYFVPGLTRWQLRLHRPSSVHRHPAEDLEQRRPPSELLLAIGKRTLDSYRPKPALTVADPHRPRSANVAVLRLDLLADSRRSANARLQGHDRLQRSLSLGTVRASQSIRRHARGRLVLWKNKAPGASRTWTDRGRVGARIFPTISSKRTSSSGEGGVFIRDGKSGSKTLCSSAQECVTFFRTPPLHRPARSRCGRLEYR